MNEDRPDTPHFTDDPWTRPARANRKEIEDAYEELKNAHIKVWDLEEKDETNKVEMQKAHNELQMCRDKVRDLKQ